MIQQFLLKESKESEDYVKSQKYVDDFAVEGLRTLFLAYKVLEEGAWKEWNKEVEQAKLEIDNREEKVAAVDAKIEQDLLLLGSTAIEDKL